MNNCFHCGLPAYEQYCADISGEKREFCCVGCLAIAQAINEGGLSDFYQFRDSVNGTASSQTPQYNAYDLEDVQSEFVCTSANGYRTAKLNVVGISCAACAWLIEKFLSSIVGVHQVRVNVSARRCLVEWDNDVVELSSIMGALSKIGYQPQPALPSTLAETQKKEQRGLLLRLGLAGIGMMQVGMVAIGLYAGETQGIEPHWQFFLRCVSWIIATPVLLYSANPFFKSAYRSVLLKHLNMDVPITLALTIAYVASAYATLSRSGDVYFDSISMLTFFLLLGRYIEAKARHSSAFTFSNLSLLLPLSVELFDENEKKLIPAKSVRVGDQIWVASGSVIPFDGVIVDGQTTVDESILTGEAEPLRKCSGENILAGSTNGDTGIRMEVSAVAQQTLLAKIENLIEAAASSKPRQQELADKVAAYFVGAVLVVAVVVSVAWYFIASEKILWVLISVLVVTCPCALSLATPVALTAGTLKLRKLGVIVRSRQFLEILPSIDKIIFDKTGTLTEGKLSVAEVRVFPHYHNEIRKEKVLDYIAALELNSVHPIAAAFKKTNIRCIATHVQVDSGNGVLGIIAGAEFRFGHLRFSLAQSSVKLEYPGPGLWQLLTKGGEPIAWILLADTPRVNIGTALDSFKNEGLEVEVLSGDRYVNVETFCREFNIEHYQGALRPEDKLEAVRAIQLLGQRVLMVGDGINDVPTLSGADVSMAMAGSTHLAESKADSVLMNGDLTTLANAVTFSKKVKSVIWQNFGWAVMYNLVALPAAAAGVLPPYMAAIGMSLSSLVVVLNALRLNR